MPQTEVSTGRAVNTQLKIHYGNSHVPRHVQSAELPTTPFERSQQIMEINSALAAYELVIVTTDINQALTLSRK